MKSKANDQQESNFPSGLANPARRALAGAGYKRLEDLTKVSESEIAQLHGIGPKGIDLLRNALAANGLSFADSKRTE